jgi:hypothetical protein
MSEDYTKAMVPIVFRFLTEVQKNENLKAVRYKKLEYVEGHYNICPHLDIPAVGPGREAHYTFLVPREESNLERRPH